MRKRQSREGGWEVKVRKFSHSSEVPARMHFIKCVALLLICPCKVTQILCVCNCIAHRENIRSRFFRSSRWGNHLRGGSPAPS